MLANLWICSSVRYEWRNICTVTNSCVLQLHRRLPSNLVCVRVKMYLSYWERQRKPWICDFFITVKRAASAWQSSKLGRNSSNADFVDVQLSAQALSVHFCATSFVYLWRVSGNLLFGKQKLDVLGILQSSKLMCFNNNLCLTDFSKI